MAKTTLVSSKDYISIREASKKHNYCLNAVRQWCIKHKVKAFKHANKWYVEKQSLEDLVNSKA
jgi:hypothetical protein